MQDTANSQQTLSESSDQNVDDFYVVGIGASAGGLESLERFFAEASPESGMAYVVVQHLSPDFKSMMDELLARYTEIPINRVEEGMEVRPNNIYLLPPKKEMIITDGRLHLTDKDRKQVLTLPIDCFFRSLAQDFRKRAIGVILSGTGSDGSRGIRDIHDAGGLVVCEDRSTAKFDGMPLSAQQTGFVDLVLNAEAIPAALREHSLSPEQLLSQARSIESQKLEGVEAVFDLLRREYDIDFSHYKQTTVGRRIERRLAMMHDNLDEYVDRLRNEPTELNALYKDLLIGVTKFFRDAEVYEDLEKSVIPALLEQTPVNQEIRVWVAGCATGEEAYSITILIHEALERAQRPVNLKVFATDVHKASLDHAGQGVFSEERLAEISPQRLQRYFSERDGYYQVSQELRQLIVFARHNIIKDAPFTNLDLISCRNLLIYFQGQAQAKALSLFHFGLNVGGTLLLGSSESPGELSDEFTAISDSCKTYRKRRDAKLPIDIRVPMAGPSRTLREREEIFSRTSRQAQVANENALYDSLLDKHMPPSLLVDSSRQLVESFGGAERLLRLKGRRVSRDLFDLLQTDAKTSIAGALNRVIKHGRPLSFAGVKLVNDEEHHTYRVDIEQIGGEEKDSEPHYLITFTAIDLGATTKGRIVAEVHPDEMTQDQVRHLEEELHYTKENLQATIEELETSNEEMQATNQELVASNEELQSTNEELHSVNEELYTVNAEHQKKIQQLAILNQDMEHLLRSTEVAIVFLDLDLRIRKFTPRVAEVFDLVEQDVGRRISAFSHRIENVDLVSELSAVLADDAPREQEVLDTAGNSYFLRLLPYRVDDSTEGVVLSLIDISTLIAAQENVRQERERFERVISANRDGIWDWPDVNQDEMWWSPACYTLLGYQPNEFPSNYSNWIKRIHPEDRLRVQETSVPARRHCYVALHRDFEYRMEIKSGEYRWFRHTAIVDHDETGKPYRMTGSVGDIHDRKSVEMRNVEEIRNRDNFLAMLSHELRNPLSTICTSAQILNATGAAPEVCQDARVTIDRQALQMSRLLDDLLDVSRITQDKIKLKSKLIDLRDTVHDAVQSVGDVAADREIKLEVSLPDQPIPIEGDSVRLQQMQANLLTNAIKYSSPGEKVLLELTQDHNVGFIRVIDHGAGIPGEILESIFDMFVQADETLDRARGGMGVGLTLVRKIVELHGGWVTAKSDGPGTGSVFEVRLPIAEGIDEPSEEPPEATESLEAPVERLLLVEDQADSRRMLSTLLQLEGLDVIAAPDGVEGLRLAKDAKPDAAIIDIGLPKIDGYEVARRLRQVMGDQILLIALTGYGQAQDVERAKAAGFDHHMVKPIEPDLLKTVLGIQS